MKTPISMSMHEFRSVLLLFVVTVILSLSPGTLHAQLPSYVPTNGLIGYWPFDGDVSDKSGNSNGGTASDVSFGDDRFGKTNSAGVFGSVSRVAVRLPQTPVGDQAKTIACWVYSESYESPDRFIAGFPIRSATQAFGLAALRCCPRDLCLWGMDYDYFAGGSLTNGRWHFIAAAYESGVLRLVIDDSVVVRTSSGFNTADVDFVIGCFEPGIRELHSIIGKIDDVGLWDRALTNDELRTLFNGQACNVTITSQPQSVIVPPSTQAQLSITTSSDSLTTYTWQISNGSGFVDLTEGNDYAGVSTSQLTIASVSSSTAGKYRCVASTSQCSVTSQIAIVRFQSANLPSYVPAAGLVGWWPFNGNANDESGIGNDGIVNGATLAIDRDGIANSAFAFNGSSSTIDCPYPSIPQKGSFTISLWVNPSSVSGVQEFLHQNWWPAAFYVGVNGGVMRCGDYWQNTGVSIASSNWQHIVIVRNYLSNVEIYLNGTLKASLGADITLGGDTTNPLVFGKQYSGNSEYYNGVLDDIGIWDRTLTEAEIQALYLSTACNVTITAQPQSTEARLSERVLLGVSANADTAMTYQWQFNAGSQFVDLVDGGKYSGVLTAQLTIDSMSAATEGEYRCIVSTSKCSVTSQPALVRVSVNLPSYIPTNGLLGWWPFDSNADDESGNRNDGVVTGATPTFDRTGTPNSAYSFDGLQNKIAVNMTPPSGAEPRTISSWFTTTADLIPTSQYPELQTIVAWGNGEGGAIIFDQYVHCRIAGDTMAVRGRAYFESGSSDNQLTSSGVVNDGQWHHMVTTYAGPGTRVKLYVDGKLQDSTVPLTLITAVSEVGIGYCPWANIPFRGEIDDVGIWNRALTETEIQSLYLGKPCNLSITSHPASSVVRSSERVVLSVTAVSDSMVAYSWQMMNGGVFVDLTDGSDYTGVTTPQLSIASMSTSTVGAYRCVVSTSQCSLTSQIANVSINTVSLPDYVPAAGLVGWWPFNGNAKDESGNQNHADSVNGATLALNRFGEANSSYLFDGIDDYLLVPKPFFDNGWKDWTVSLWYKLDPSSNFGLFLNTDPHWGMALGVGTGAEYRLGIGNAAGSWNVLDPGVQHSNTDFVYDQWAHVTVVKNGLQVSLYVNGVRDSTVVGASLPPAYLCKMYFGRAHQYGEYYKGLLDDIGLWSRALSASEIESLYNGTAQPRGQIDVGSFNYGTLPSDELINSSGGHVGSVTVRNRTGVDLELVGADVSDSTVFVVPNQWPRRMYNGDSTEIAIRFLPREKRLYQADFTVRASNSFTGISTVAGTGRDLNADERVTQVLLRPSQEFVAPGDTLSVALRVGIERPLTTAGTAGKYFAMIQWDSRVLEPLPTPGLKFDTAGTYGVGELQNSSRQQNQMQLYTFRFRAKQAEVDTTTIIFTGAQGFAWQDDRKAYPALVDSVVRVRVCQDGGPQLVGRMLPARIVRATPSPARDAVDIELNLSGAGTSAGTIDVMSADGRRVMTREVNHDTKNLRLDLSGLSAGIYTVVLTTPTTSDHVTMIVVP